MKTGTNEANFVKIVQGIHPLRGVYIPHFDQISVKISVLGVLYPCRCTDGCEIWHGGGAMLPVTSQLELADWTSCRLESLQTSSVFNPENHL